MILPHPFLLIISAGILAVAGVGAFAVICGTVERKPHDLVYTAVYAASYAVAFFTLLMFYPK